MATETQRERLREDIGADSTSLPDADADAIFTEAGEAHTDATAIKAATRVIAIRRLLASSAKLTTYKQNASSENLSDVFKHLRMLLGVWQGELDDAVAGASANGAARFGGIRRKPKKIREYPD
jgi:hypothetical protein